MNVSQETKEMIGDFSKQLGLPMNELQDEFKRAYVIGQEKTDNPEKYAQKKLKSFLKRQLASSAVLMEGWIIGHKASNDFGAKREFDKFAEAKQQGKHQEMIDSGKFTQDGHYVKISGKGDNTWTTVYERPIDAMTKELLIRLTYEKGEVKDEMCVLTLKGEKTQMFIPSGQKVRFRAISTEKFTTNGFRRLIGANVTEIGVLNEPPLNLLNFIKEKFSDKKIAKLSELTNAEKNQFVAVRGDVVSLKIFSNGATVEIDDESLDDYESNFTSVQCSLAKENIDCDEDAEGVVLIGDASSYPTTKGGEEKVVYKIDAYAMWTPDIWRKKPTEKVSPEKVKETTEDVPAKTETPTPTATPEQPQPQQPPQEQPKEQPKEEVVDELIWD